MFWIIVIIALIANEYSGGEGWYKNTVRNLAVFALIAAAAVKNPGGSLAALIIALAAFIGWELYLADCRNESAKSRKLSQNRPEPQEFQTRGNA